MQTVFRGAIDLSFGPQMSPREHRSLANQIVRVFGANRKHPNPMELHLTSVAAAREAAPACLPAEHHLRAWLQGEGGLFHLQDAPACATWPADETVWLSPDAVEPLEDLSPACVYVLGGLIDRSVDRGASLTRALEHGAVARRLPLREFAPRADVHPILSLLSCWQMLADVGSGASWEESIARNLPARYLSRREREELQRLERREGGAHRLGHGCERKLGG